MRWWQLALAAGALLGLLALVPLQFHFRYERIVDQPERLAGEVRVLGLRITLDGLLRWAQKREEQTARRKDKPKPDAATGEVAEAEPHGLARLRELLTRVREAQRYLVAVRYLLQSLHVGRWELAIEFGTGDAAATGLVIGAIWALFGTMQAVLRETTRLTPGQPRFHLQPNFTKAVLQTRFACIVTIRIGHIIAAGAKLLQTGLKGVPSWRVSTPSRG